MIADEIEVRHDLRPGDLGRIVAMHGTLYGDEYGFDASFEAYVAGPLAVFVLAPDSRNRLWIAERRGEFAGCIAVVAVEPTVAQIRWFLVAPPFRRHGLGSRLLREAVQFARECRYSTAILWTVDALESAARRYREFGFRPVERSAGLRWGVEVVEEKYELTLADSIQENFA